MERWRGKGEKVNQGAHGAAGTLMLKSKTRGIANVDAKNQNKRNSKRDGGIRRSETGNSRSNSGGIKAG